MSSLSSVGLKCDRKHPSESDKLTIDTIGVTNISIQSFTKLVGIGSKSDDLHGANRMRRRTSSSVTWVRFMKDLSGIRRNQHIWAWARGERRPNDEDFIYEWLTFNQSQACTCKLQVWHSSSADKDWWKRCWIIMFMAGTVHHKVFNEDNIHSCCTELETMWLAWNNNKIARLVISPLPPWVGFQSSYSYECLPTYILQHSTAHYR